MSKIQIQVVTWNSRSYLERLFLGINKQEGADFNVVVIDNASTDGTIAEITNNQSSIIKKITIINNQENRGFAAAHNQGFAICEAPYVLVLNPDTELQPGYLAEVLRVIESDNKVGAVQGKLYRQLPEGKKYGIIDSCGLKMKAWGQIVDIGQNSVDKGDFEAQAEVFGATGACALYRLEALKQVADKHGIFDERFGSYKEDVDLAWRLQRAGWKAVFAPRAVAWHGRGVGKGDKRGWRIRYLSLRNHLLMILKNIF